MMLRAAAGWRRGFTLVEVLVVTVIIGILLALVSTAVFPALQSAKEFAITSEAGQMSMAMESLKAEYGTGNPPADLSNPNQQTSDIYKFVSRTFPRYDVSNLETDLPPALGVAAAADIKFDPGNALVFWLVGFSDNPAAPFQGHAARMDGSDMSSPFYDFDTDRLGTDSTGTIRYFPKLSVDDYADAPPQRAFLYFDKKAYGAPYDPDAADPLPEFWAYQSSAGTQSYYNPKGAQIINAGLDGQLGVGGAPKDANGDPADIFSGADADNLTNFSGGTMGDYTDQ